ncbi:MAG TPA: SAM-dependent methyltransferase [Deltaproteobacteria bacterium]|mgnify:CR=1 FL=1|nr:SAM-dependent methyltransferase [Deltaproteobacteria bacterium]HCP46189.1 SAM-dependent methyltransferase [Deltaproteobacteria bacterium]
MSQHLDTGSPTLRTIAHYDHHADQFWEGTKDHDVQQNINALLRALGPGQHEILDLGCGPGRDLRALKTLGHHPTGLDGSSRFVAMAKEYSGCPVLHQDFLQLDLPAQAFDGIFANASLFHVPSAALGRVLGELADALRPDGVLFSSNPRGQNQEGWNGERYGAYHDLNAWREFVMAAGFDEVEHYYRPQGAPRDQQPWLATVFRKLNHRSPQGTMEKRSRRG